MSTRRKKPAAKASPTILEAMDHPDMWQRWFKDTASWAAWRAFQAAMDGLPMSQTELEIFRRHTGRSAPREGGYTEAVIVVGRRGGKSLQLAVKAVHTAVFRDWRPYLAPGERAYVVVIAADRRQARTIMGYVRALLKETPALAALVEKDNAEDIELSNGITIEVATCSYRTIRGRTIVAGLCDEAAFWSDPDGANPDYEVLNALRPAMATVPGAVLLIASSPYARRGIVWDGHKEHFGKDESLVLAWQGATQDMNPSPRLQSVIAAAYERDPVSAAAEYGGQFRTDVDAFLSREVVDAAVVLDRHELARVEGMRYFGFVDPSGGSHDAMTLAVAHREQDGRILVDAIRERRPPFSPEAVVAEFAEVLKSYGLGIVTGDRYAGEWPRERFAEHGIQYRASLQSKSEIYLAALPLLNSGRVELLDHPRMVAQFCGLERRTARGGRDSVDHAPGAHDDIANAVAGALVLASKPPEPTTFAMPIVTTRSNREMTFEAWNAEQMAGADPFRWTY
jgi:hypothetical protein